jgi:hypothetical protein
MPEASELFKHLETDPQGGSQHLLELLERFFLPFLLLLDEVLDKRLVRTLLQCLVAIIRFRKNPQALWLSELGSYLDGYDGLLLQCGSRHQAGREAVAVGEMDGGTH